LRYSSRIIMAAPTIPLIAPRDLDFILYELLEVERLLERRRFADHSRETFEATIATARRVAEARFRPHNRANDENEPQWDGRRIAIIPEVKAALDAFSEAGFMAAQADFDQGGMQLPVTVAQAAFGLFTAANIGTAAYAFLTIAAGNLLEAFGSNDQKRVYLPPMRAGRWFGTMALTEPQAGSSLAEIRTTAKPAADGSYHLRGSKIFISGGDHELSENIVHMVLARIDGAPPGVRGISLFLVPKFLPKTDGTPGRRNGVALAGLIHKMGYRGTTSTMLNFGETEPCIGTLIGEPHQGLACMFHMMNEARIGVGLGAAVLGYAGYLYSLDYARTRTQGRRPGAKGIDAPPVRLIAHADVRRMLIAQKAYVEGGLALCLMAARLVDDEKTHPDEAERRRAALLLEVLTPVVKAWPSQYGLAANDLAIQILGGYGYTRDHPVEQYFRDNRLNPIHEGTNGIQALDLLGRKVRMAEGAAFRVLTEAIEKDLGAAGSAAPSDETVVEIALALGDALAATRSVTARLVDAMEKDTDRGLANASLYLDMMGKLVVGWLWLRQASLAAKALAAGSSETEFYEGKRQTALWFARYELPQTSLQASLLTGGETAAYDMRDAWF